MEKTNSVTKWHIKHKLLFVFYVILLILYILLCAFFVLFLNVVYLLFISWLNSHSLLQMGMTSSEASESVVRVNLCSWWVREILDILFWLFSAIWTKTHYSIHPEQCLNVRCQISVKTERKKYVLAKSYPVIFSTFRRATSKNERNVHNSQVPIYVYGYIWVKSRTIWLFDVLLICSTDRRTW